MDTRPERLKTERVFSLYYLLSGIAEETRWNQRSQDCLFAVFLENLSEVRLNFDIKKIMMTYLLLIQIENPLLCLI